MYAHIRLHFCDGDHANTDQALNTSCPLRRVSVMCVYDTVFELCKLFTARR